MSDRFRFRAVAALAVGLLAGGCDRHKQDEAPPPVRPVLSLVVAATTPQVERSFTGSVEPRYKAQLGFQTIGRMISRNANVGDRVTHGQTLATLDPVVARLALASSQADLANAQAQLVNTAATLGRQQALIRTQSVSQSQLDAAVATHDTAQARVGQAQASLQKAWEQLGYTTLSSDYDGVVASWSAEVGQVVMPSKTVVTIARPDARDAVFDVADDLLDLFAPGRRLTVSLLASAATTATGEVREISPQSDAATRTRRIRLTLVDAPDAFRLGTTVRVTLIQTETPAIEVPQSAILERDGKTSVWLVGPDNKALSRPVTLGVPRDGKPTVRSGLAPGDRVIVAGVHSLSDGQPIKLPGE